VRWVIKGWTSQHLTKTNMNEVSKFRQEMDGILRRELIAISTKNLGPKLHNCKSQNNTNVKGD